MYPELPLHKEPLPQCPLLPAGGVVMHIMLFLTALSQKNTRRTSPSLLATWCSPIRASFSPGPALNLGGSPGGETLDRFQTD